MTTAEPSAPLRTGWEEGTPSTDTLSLAALRAMADRTTDWAEAVGGRVRRDPGMVLAHALSPCLSLNVATVSAVVDPATARAAADFSPGRAGPGRAPRSCPAAGDLGAPAGPGPGRGTRRSRVRAAGCDGARGRRSGSSRRRGPRRRRARRLGPCARRGVPHPRTHRPRPRCWAARPGSGWPGRTANLSGPRCRTSRTASSTSRRWPRCPDTRRGVGAAVTWAATLADPDLPAVLIASDDGAGVYREMGYLPVTRWTLWWCRP